jgi:hypothetical protein
MIAASNSQPEFMTRFRSVNRVNERCHAMLVPAWPVRGRTPAPAKTQAAWIESFRTLDSAGEV